MNRHLESHYVNELHASETVGGFQISLALCCITWELYSPIRCVVGTVQPLSRIKNNLAKSSASRDVGPDLVRLTFLQQYNPDFSLISGILSNTSSQIGHSRC